METRKQEKVDILWGQRLEKSMRAVTVYNAVEIPKAIRDELHKSFIADPENIPDLTQFKFDEEKYDNMEKDLLELKKDMEEQENNPAIRLAYLWIINTELATVRLIWAAHNKDIRRFKRYSEFIYGAPDPVIFNYSLEKTWKKIEKGLNSENPEAQRIALELSEVIHAFSEKIEKLEIPSSEIFQNIKARLVGRFAPYLSEVEEREYGSEDLRDIFLKIFDQLGFSDWKVEISDKSLLINFSGYKTLKIPAGKPYKTERVRELIVHEILGHAQRTENDYTSKLYILEKKHGQTLVRRRKANNFKSTVA